MHSSHDTPLVLLSILIAICASYTALSLAGRVTVAQGRARAAWLLGGCIAMGSGIWSMHFVAMLAFHLPVPIRYDIPMVALSHLAGVGASAFALFVASRPTVSNLQMIVAGQGLGLAIVTMHYTGMAAVRVPADLGYDPVLVTASVLIACGAATVALWLFLRLRNDNTRRGQILRGCAAVVMGLAIAGMHYTAMAAARFSEMPHVMPASGGFELGTSGLAWPVAVGAFVILTLTMLGSITDHWVRVKLAGAEALRESEERYRSVVSDIDEVIFRTDAVGRWTFLNPAWTKITGYAVDASLSVPKIEFVHPEDRAASNAQCKAMVDGTLDYYRHEVRYLRQDGGFRWVEVHARVTRGPEGKLLGTTGVIRDITERRQVEDALRTAREAAEAASRAKSEFLSRMSHELRTPLNAILGFGQLMDLDASTPDQRESTSQILRAGRHLLSLINEVLDITGIEAGQLHLSTEPVRVSEVVEEVIDLMQPLAAARSVRVIPESAGLAGRFAHADRQRLKQVLLNLVANAVKYNNEGGRVHITCEEGDNGRIRIVVTDNGPGIPAAKMSRLFTPFDRLGTDANVEGTGLGLALSKRLVEAMKGTIGVRSAAGAGCTFWIELPLVDSPATRLEMLTAHPSVVPGHAALKPRGKVLYVEDNLSNLTLMKKILGRHERIELIPTMTGGLALDLARQHQPALILLDLHLPDIPGDEVLAQLRRDAVCCETPVVILSADATPGQAERLIAAGANAYMTKPIDLKQFIALLDEVLEVREAA
jgi:PAS domain S-box-containing protein